VNYEILENEQEAFNQQRRQLAEEHAGCFVVFKDEAVVSSAPTFDQAYRSALAEYGLDGNFLVAKASVGGSAFNAVGPLVGATWSVPTPMADYLEEHDEPVAEPVTGFLILDTGAQATCISLEAASQLQLRPTSIRQVFGSGGVQSSPTFRVGVEIAADRLADGSALRFEATVQGLAGLEGKARELQLEVGGEPARLIGLLGRSLLRHTAFCFDGEKGLYDFHFDPQAIQKD
jgi:hypothetical protein